MRKPETPWYVDYEPVPFDANRAQELLDYFERYEYASRDHVLLALLWETDLTPNDLHALDFADVDLDTGVLELSHRPDRGTSLKGGSDHERRISIDDELVELLVAHFEHKYQNVIDDYDRRPLITSPRGRLVPQGIRYTIAKWTRPCKIDDCPHDRDPERCEAVVDPHAANWCPSSVTAQDFYQDEQTAGDRDE